MPIAIVSVLERRPVGFETIAHEGLHAVVMTIGGSVATPEEVKRFATLQADVHRSFDSVPIRLGTCLPSADAVRDHLVRGADRYRALLARFGGCVEYTVRVEHESLPDAGPRPRLVGGAGHEYLESLRESQRERDGIAESLDRFAREALLPLRAIAGDYRVEPASPNVPMAAVTFIMARAAASDFVARYRQLPVAESATLTGPWPPSTFSSSVEAMLAA